jgi:hypothetical protein
MYWPAMNSFDDVKHVNYIIPIPFLVVVEGINYRIHRRVQFCPSMIFVVFKTAVPHMRCIVELLIVTN